MMDTTQTFLPRTAEMTLNQQTIEFRLSGLAEDWNLRDDEAEQVASLRAMLTQRFPSMEVSQVDVRCLMDGDLVGDGFTQEQMIDLIWNA